MSRRSLLSASCLIVAIAGCSTGPQSGGPPTPVPAIEQVAWEAIGKGAPVIDVRTAEEFRQGHLPGAINIPYDEIASRVGELPPDRSQPIVLYCRTGRRSGIARTSLEQLGFTHAINAGGYDAMMRAQPR